MTTALVPTNGAIVPAGEQAKHRFWEFFAGQIAKPEHA